MTARVNNAAARLRAQKAYSTDPDYLERMACAEEAYSLGPAAPVANRGEDALARRLAAMISEWRAAGARG